MDIYGNSAEAGLTNGGTINGSLEITEDLDVVGTLTAGTIITEQELEVKDVLITCGIDNPADSSNLGLLEEYQIGGGTKRWAGLVRSFSDKTQYLLEDMAVKPTPGSDVTNLPRARLAVADLQISNYSMPSLDGTLGQVLTTSGGGIVTFEDPSSGSLQNSFLASTEPHITTSQVVGNTDLVVREGALAFNDLVKIQNSAGDTNITLKADGEVHCASQVIQRQGGGEGDVFEIRNLSNNVAVALGSDGAIFATGDIYTNADLVMDTPTDDEQLVVWRENSTKKWSLGHLAQVTNELDLLDEYDNQVVRFAQGGGVGIPGQMVVGTDMGVNGLADLRTTFFGNANAPRDWSIEVSGSGDGELRFRERSNENTLLRLTQDGLGSGTIQASADLIIKDELDEIKVSLGSDGAIFGNSAFLDGGDLKISRNGDGATVQLMDTGVVKWKLENISGDQFVLEDGSGNEFIRCAQNAIMSFQRPSAFEAGYIGLNGLGGAEFQFQNAGDTTWVLNSDGDDKFLLRSPLGTAIEIDQANIIRLLGQVKIGSGGTPYTMPSARGTAGQVLVDTLGNGDVSWEDEKGSSETLQEAYNASSIPHLLLPAEGLVLKSGVPGPPGLILDCRDFLDEITCRISRDGTGYFARTVSFDEEAYLYAGLVIGDISTVNYYRPPANNIGALDGDVLRYDATARQLKFARQNPNNFSQTETKNNSTGTTDQIQMLGIGLGYRTILANVLQVGSTFHIKAGGNLRNSNTSSNLRLRLFLGGNIIADSDLIILPFVNTLGFWECEFDISFRGTGANSVSAFSSQFTVQDGTAYVGKGFAGSLSTVNSTVDNIWTLTSEWATASTDNLLIMQQFYISQII